MFCFKLPCQTMIFYNKIKMRGLNKGGKIMTNSVKEEDSGGQAEIYTQFACVETSNWQTLPKGERMMISTTDRTGKYGKPMPITRDVFEQTFFPAAAGIFQKRVRVVLHLEIQTAELIVLDAQGRETGRKYNVSIKTLQENFQPDNNA
ncbi:MAG: hypothetical protein A2Y67_00305 [Candidatus Buchananbacteria bacterium RBG_13_39_9]|uniref:Uncharacterized protein n=1 Tax=Candidatus Buchananbacteria bacterium RBG_13_39_9 TaxID=1797531 RepID=A0A1G1XQT7_9BACT|nr:MAG: hypothetical protein A2Y67_00305 [Candidatus Buchananbacteria bacterium RBG_13_39_9]